MFRLFGGGLQAAVAVEAAVGPAVEEAAVASVDLAVEALEAAVQAEAGNR